MPRLETKETKGIMNEEMHLMMRKLDDALQAICRLQQNVERLRAEVSHQKAHGQMWTMREVMEYAHVGRTFLMARLADHSIPFAVKEGGKWLFPVDETKAWFGHTN